MRKNDSLISIFVAGCLALSGRAIGADSVVLGRGIANQYYADLPCPADSICLDATYIWELEAARTVAGPLVKGRIRALISQHTDATRKFVQSVELFVLREIQDPNLCKTSGAQYYLLSLSRRYNNDEYCLSMRPADVGLAVPESQITERDGNSPSEFVTMFSHSPDPNPCCYPLRKSRSLPRRR